MEQAKYDIFISYRRESGTHQAKALRAVLENMGYSVFIDTRKMGSGDFTKKLDEKIRESCNFVVIISKDCFPHKKEGTDYFLYEITLALKLGKNVIPVYYDGMSYESIQKYLFGLEDFNKQNYIIYHDDADEGSDNQLVSYLKTEKEVLNDRFISLSKERAIVRKELVLIEKNKVNPKCPVCGASHSIAMTYCNTCGYKFFDDLEKLAVDPIEQLQEDERLEKHKEIWRNCRSDENVAELKQQLHETEMKLRNATEECNELGKQLEEQFHTYNNEYDELKNQMRLRLDEAELEHKQQEKRLKDQLQESETKRKELEGHCVDLEKQLKTFKNNIKNSDPKKKTEEETNFTIRLSKAAKEFNVGVATIREFLAKKGFQVDSSPNAKLTSDMYALLVKEFQGEKEVKNEAMHLAEEKFKAEEKRRLEEATPKERVFTVGETSFKMIRVDGGTFQMGSPNDDMIALDDEKPQHWVTLNDYYIGETVVTQALWEAVMGSNPSYYKSENNPVETVNWNDCQKFIEKLNAKTNQKFRLPTEAEWEYAARGGGKSQGYKYASGNDIDEVAWYNVNSKGKTQPVKGKCPNELGLYDLSGNVWEWCQDWYSDKYYYESPLNNPKGPSSGLKRVLRGGSWRDEYWYSEVTSRFYCSPDFGEEDTGFRLVLSHK